MFKVLKSGHCYSPADTGIKDILIAGGKIYKIEDRFSGSLPFDIEIIDCRDRIVCPGFIDQHVHITGGGGEQGPSSRVPELMLGDVVSAGVTTLVGVLGLDAITRNMAELLAKAKSLQFEGLNTFVYTGNYCIPTATLTGRAMWDITFIDKVIGVGEIAIADYRSSYPTIQKLMELASETMIGGMVGQKAGVMHIHVGDGKDGLTVLFRLLEETDFPLSMFVPTHLNRNRRLFQQAMTYADGGGFIDLTAGEKSEKGYSVPDAVACLSEAGINMEKVTVSSDGNGSMPGNNGEIVGVGKVRQLYDDIVSCIINRGINIETAIGMVTSNAAKVLKLYPAKGAIAEGSDADILVLDKSDMTLDKVLIGGEIFLNNGRILKNGRFENADGKM